MDHLGYRMKFGVVGPSTNTVVQPDLDEMRPVGVTNHYSRIAVPEAPVTSNEAFLRLVAIIQDNTLHAILLVVCCVLN
jgi:maleate isomerase